MSLSKCSVEMLVDLVEIKISYMDLSDREDARDLLVLEQCREELRELTNGAPRATVSSTMRACRVRGPRIPG